MIHHPGEVIEIFRPGDKDIKSADNDTLATVKMWDENVMTFVVDPKIAKDIKVNDKVLVDYRLITLPENSEKPIVVIQKQVITKILDEEKAEKIWKEYKEFYNRRKGVATQPQQPQKLSYVG